MNKSGITSQPPISKFLNLRSPNSMNKSDSNTPKSSKNKNKRLLKSHKSPISYKNARLRPTKSSKSPKSSSMLKDWLIINNKENCGASNVKDRIFMATQPFDEDKARQELNKIKYYQNRIKTYEETKRYADEVKELVKNQPIYVPRMISSPEKNPHIDCYDMKERDIKAAFHKHLEFLKNVKEEKVYSERHKIFQSEKNINDLGISNLCSNVAMVAFRKEHVMWLSKKLNKWFGDDVDYQMKVLLPELLLRIFMDKYNMAEDEAYNYLSNM